MDVEFSITSDGAKTRALDQLRARGLRARSGPIRLAYPFSISIEGVDESERQVAARVIGGIDPCAGQILTSPDRTVATVA